jgi:hypothetical protein
MEQPDGIEDKDKGYSHEPNCSDMIDLSRADCAYFSNLDWLNQELKLEVDALLPQEGEEIDDDGNVNVDSIAEVARKHFSRGRYFYNFYQLKQFVERFAAQWGFAVTTQGNSIVCACAKSNTKAHASNVSPSKQRYRQTSLKVLECSWRITSSYVRESKKKTIKHNESDSNISQSSKPPKRVSTRVFITNGCKLEHSAGCTPGKTHQQLARKSSGAYAVKIDHVKEIIAIMEAGYVPTRTLRSLLRAHTPADVPISANDIRNFRLRALMYCSCPANELHRNQIKTLLEFESLDARELASLDNDATSTKALAILRQVLQETGEGWNVICYLNEMKKSFEGFDYRISNDATSGKPTAVVWLTPTMRKMWKRFSDALFLDAQKRQRNKLQWPYIAVTIIDHENTIGVACESIVLEESHEAYAFILKSLFEMEPVVKKESIKVIYGDGLLTPNLLELVGISDTARLVWDHYHLLNEIWPRQLGESISALIAKKLSALVYANTEEEYHIAFKSIETSLPEYPVKVAYLRGYYNQPDLFAKYSIRRIPSNLKKHGSTHAEQNHSSTSAHFGKEVTCLDPVQQIRGLLERQGELRAKRKHREAKYRHTCSVLGLLPSDPRNVLSKYCYDKIWTKSYCDYTKYTVTLLDGGNVCVHRNGTPALSARIIKPNQRCDCEDRISWQVQCVHELALSGGQFDKTQFASRHFQEHMCREPKKSLNKSLLPQELECLSFSESVDHCHDATVEEVVEAASDVTVTAVEVAAVVTKKKPISFNDIMTRAGELARSVQGHPKYAEMAMGTIISMTKLCRGENSASVVEQSFYDLINGLAQQFSSGTPDTNYLEPIAAVNAVGRQGRLPQARKRSRLEGKAPDQHKRRASCGFCSEPSHTIMSCPRRREYGTMVKIENIPMLTSQLEEPSSTVYPAFPLPVGCITPIKPLLHEIPPETQWMVLVSKCFMSNDQHLRYSTSNLCIIVTCLGKAGMLMSKEFTGRAITVSAVTKWINSTKLRKKAVFNKIPMGSAALSQLTQDDYQDG